MEPFSGRRWAVYSSASGTVMIAGGAFWLSFVALADLARRSGIEREQWVWPLLVDGLIVVATVAVVALDGHQTSWYPWALLVAGALVSVTANALHAVVAADANIPVVLAAAVAAVPPLVLLASTHLTVVLIRSTKPRTVAEPAVAVANPAPAAAGAAEREETPAEPVEPVEPEPEPAEAVEPEPELVEPAPEPPVEAPEVDRRAEAARLRREHGWSNKRIARELDVHPSTVGRWLPRPGTDPDPSSASDFVSDFAVRDRVDVSGAGSPEPAGVHPPMKEATP